MEDINLADNYNKIAGKWDAQMQNSQYGLSMVDRAIKYCSAQGNALDIGCGSGGRIVERILAAGYALKGIDISSAMLGLARAKHPGVDFREADIRTWETDQKYDLIIAWDSVFHLREKHHKPVVEKMCGMLNPQGILLYTFGDAQGEHTDTWYDEKFTYGSIGISENLKVTAECGCECKHLELDQFPGKHVCIIVEKK